MPYCSVLNGAGRVLETHPVAYKDYSFNKGGQYQAIEALLPSVAEEATRIDVYEQQPGCGSTLLSTYHLKGVKPKAFHFVTHVVNLTHRTPEKAGDMAMAPQVVNTQHRVPEPVLFIAPPKPAPTVDSDQDNPFSLFE